MTTSIRITQYKSTGKYYGHTDVSVAGEFDLFTDEFIKLVYSNLSNKNLGSDTYVVVADRETGDGFHNRQYRLSELERLYKLAVDSERE